MTSSLGGVLTRIVGEHHQFNSNMVLQNLAINYSQTKPNPKSDGWRMAKGRYSRRTSTFDDCLIRARRRRTAETVWRGVMFLLWCPSEVGSTASSKYEYRLLMHTLIIHLFFFVKYCGPFSLGKRSGWMDANNLCNWNWGKVFQVVRVELKRHSLHISGANKTASNTLPMTINAFFSSLATHCLV